LSKCSAIADSAAFGFCALIAPAIRAWQATFAIRSSSVARLHQPVRQVCRVITSNNPTMSANSGLRDALAIAV
jgi:hypothetical protein